MYVVCLPHARHYTEQVACVSLVTPQQPSTYGLLLPTFYRLGALEKLNNFLKFIH